MSQKSLINILLQTKLIKICILTVDLNREFQILYDFHTLTLLICRNYLFSMKPRSERPNETERDRVQVHSYEK